MRTCNILCQRAQEAIQTELEPQKVSEPVDIQSFSKQYGDILVSSLTSIYAVEGEIDHVKKQLPQMRLHHCE